MPEAALPATCPFVLRLIGLLATDLPASPSMAPDVTVRLLRELEAEAERYGASEGSKRAIMRVRQWAGDALGPQSAIASCRQSAAPMVYRTVYHSAGRTAGWASSTASLFAAIEAARREMSRHGADAVQIVEDDGLGAVVWSAEGDTDPP